jgi:hypothetical protein
VLYLISVHRGSDDLPPLIYRAQFNGEEVVTGDARKVEDQE